MILTVKRKHYKENYTIGEMLIDGRYFCDTLEDKVRPDGVKIYGETAIPEGKYKMILSYSKRFKKILPEILDVPMFTGIRIHAGVNENHTKGCILAGINNEVGRINKAPKTMEKLMKILVDSGLDEFEIKIINE